MLRGKWAPVMKNIHSRKPHFPLNTEKNWPALIQKSFSATPCQHCHYISYCEDSQEHVFGNLFWGCPCGLLIVLPSCESPVLKGGWRLLGGDGAVPMCCHTNQPGHLKVSKSILISPSTKLPGMMGVKCLKREQNLFKHSERYWAWSLKRGSSRKKYWQKLWNDVRKAQHFWFP